MTDKERMKKLEEVIVALCQTYKDLASTLRETADSIERFANSAKDMYVEVDDD